MKNIKQYSLFSSLIVVVLILIIGAIFAWPLINGRANPSAFSLEKRKASTNLRQIYIALDAYQVQHGYMPTNLDLLVPEKIKMRLPSPWIQDNRDFATNDWGYILLLGRNVKHDGQRVIMMATDGKHGGWVLAEPSGDRLWINDQNYLDSMTSHGK